MFHLNPTDSLNKSNHKINTHSLKHPCFYKSISFSFFMTRFMGLEPKRYTLQVQCWTRWATDKVIKSHTYEAVSKYISLQIMHYDKTVPFWKWSLVLRKTLWGETPVYSENLSLICSLLCTNYTNTTVPWLGFITWMPLPFRHGSCPPYHPDPL